MINTDIIRKFFDKLIIMGLFVWEILTWKWIKLRLVGYSVSFVQPAKLLKNFCEFLQQILFFDALLIIVVCEQCSYQIALKSQ